MNSCKMLDSCADNIYLLSFIGSGICPYQMLSPCIKSMKEPACLLTDHFH